MNKIPSYKILVPFVAIYTLCLFIPTIDTVAIKSITLFSYKISFNVAVLIFPAIYPLGDSLTEVYGRQVAYYVSISCYIVIISFSLINNFLLSNIDDIKLYQFIVQPSLIITIAGPISYLVTCFININLIYKLKIKMRQKHFIFRCFLCSSISGFITSLIVQLSLNYKYGFNYFFKIFLTIFILKVVVTMFYIYLAKILVVWYRYVDDLNPEVHNKGLATYALEQGY